MSHDIPELDRAGLRQFAFVTGGIVAGLFGLFFPWLLDLSWPRWPWGLAIVLVVWGVVAPQTLRGVYRTWMRFGLLLNRIVTPVVLGIVFFAAITPMALISRIKGRDTMARSFDSRAESYRVASTRQPPEKMEKPF